jgi:hypothetical protein
MISPRYTYRKFEKPTIDDLVDVFEDRIRGWMLDPAKTLLGTEYGEVAAFSLLLTYPEAIWSYTVCEPSEGKPKQFFSNGFVDVLRPAGLDEAVLKRVGDVIYADARCGFFHEGLFRRSSVFPAHAWRNDAGHSSTSQRRVERERANPIHSR